MLRILLVVLSFITTSANAGALVIAKYHAQQIVTSNLKLDAEYVAIPVKIVADYKNPKERISAIEQARKSLIGSIENQNGLTVQPGVVSLSPNEKASFSLKSYSRGSDVRIYILGELSGNNTVFSQTRKILDVIGRVKLPDDIDLRLEETSLGISDPEKYRSELLKKIKSTVLESKSALGANGIVTVSGLENPVSVVQVNETEVSVFINHHIEVEI